MYPEEVISQFKAGLNKKEREREKQKEREKEKEKEKEKIKETPPAPGQFVNVISVKSNIGSLSFKILNYLFIFLMQQFLPMPKLP